MVPLRGILLSIMLLLPASPAFTGEPVPPGTALKRAIDAAAARSAVAHPAFIEVDTGAFVHNIRCVKEMIGPGTALCLVMKSNAYGHGLENLIGPAIESAPRYIGLVENGEIAVAVRHIRASGKNIPVLRIAPATLDEAVEAAARRWNVEELVGSAEQAAMLSAAALRLHKTRGTPARIPVHINVDTGMGRMGVMTAADIRRIMALPGLALKGIMTHFAMSDDPSEKGKAGTMEQMRRFESMLKEIEIDKSVIIHTANSAAASRFPWTRLAMVRVGSLIYGDVTKDTDPGGIFLPVMKSFRSSVALVMRDVPPLTTVGYDSIYRTGKGRPSTLATVKVGYNNGYPKDAYVNGTEVLIGGKRCPVVGKVSMNLLVVDVTDRVAVDIGDEVVLLGRQGGEVITMEELASRNRLTTYEMLLRLGNNNYKKVVHGAAATR